MNGGMEREKVQRPGSSNSYGANGALGFNEEVPEVDDVLSEIDAILAETEVRTQGGCVC